MKALNLLLLSSFFLIISCDILPKGISLYVTSSYGGIGISEVAVTVDAETEIYKTGTSGYLLLPLSKGIHTITLKKDGYAESKLQEFNFTEYSEQIELILPKLAREGATAKAPTFITKEISPVTGDSYPINNTTNLLTTDSIHISVSSKLPVLPTPDGGNGLGFLVDAVPNGFGYYAPTEYIKEGILEEETYITEVLFSLEKRLVINGTHLLCFTAYDLANNRTEIRIPVKTDSILESEKSLSTTIPELSEYKMKTFRTDRGILSTEETLYRNGTGYMVITINGIDLTNNYKEYSGFEIYRREKELLPYRLISTQTFPEHQPSYELIDGSIDIQPGKSYYYKVRAFNSSGFSNFLLIQDVEMLPEHHMEQKIPTNLETINPITTKLTFQIMEIESLIKMNPTGYDFSLNIKETSGENSFIIGGIYVPTYRVSFETGQIYIFTTTGDAEPISYITYLEGTFSVDLIKLDQKHNFPFNDGLSYEWYIDYSTHGPTCFKHIIKNSKFIGESISIASSNEYHGAIGDGALTFTIDRSIQ